MVGNQWVPGPTPPGKITSATADVLGNDVFLFGGQGSSKSSAIYVLREKSSTWERIETSLYQPRASHASLVINEKGAFNLAGKVGLKLNFSLLGRWRRRELCRRVRKDTIQNASSQKHQAQ